MGKNDKAPGALVPGWAGVALVSMVYDGPIDLGAVAVKVEASRREAFEVAEWRAYLAGLAVGVDIELEDLRWLEGRELRDHVRRILGPGLSPEAIERLGLEGGSDG